MTDELAIQSVNPQVKRKDNTGLYTVGGAVVGAAAGGLTGYYTTKPKYASHEDILKEAEDTFKKNIGEVTDDTGVIDKAVAARKAAVEAGANWDAELEKAKNANKAGIAPIDEALVNAQNDAEKAYNAKKETLVNKKIEELKKNNNTTELADWQIEKNKATEARIEQAKTNLKNYKDARESAFKKVNEHLNTAKNVDYSLLEQTTAEYKADVQNIDNIEKHLADGNYKKGAKITLKDGTVIEFKPGEKFVEPPKLTKAEYDKLTKKQIEERKAVRTKYNEIKAKLNEARVKLNSVFDSKIKTVFNTDFAEIKDADLRRKTVLQAGDAVSNLRQADDQAKAIEKYFADNTKAYNEAKLKIKDSKDLEILEMKKTKLNKSQIYQDILRLDELADKTLKTHRNRNLDELLSLEYPNSTKQNIKAEIAKLQEALKQNKVTDETINEARKIGLKNVQQEITTIKKSLPKFEQSVQEQATARRTVEAFEKHLKQLNAEGAKVEIKNGKPVITKKDGQVVNILEEMKQRLNKAVLELKVPTEGDQTLAKLEEAVANAEKDLIKPGAGLTDEQLAEKARKSITDDMLKTEKEALDKAKKAVEEAKAKAPKVEPKTDEEILKAVEEKLGKRDKVVNEALEKGKDDLKVALERKVSNKKLAAWLAGGAVVLGGLGYLLAPKNKN